MVKNIRDSFKNNYYYFEQKIYYINCTFFYVIQRVYIT